MATIIDGKELSKKLKEQMKDRVAQMRQQGIVPKLVVVLVGNNSASEVYVRNKHKACGEVGIESEVIKMPEETTQQELLDVVKGLNEDRTVDGILVQLPLPSQINEKVVLRSILPEKDVDGFHPVNVGLLSIGDDCYAPATPSGIIAMFKEYGIEIAGKHCVDYKLLPCTPAGIMELIHASGVEVKGKECVVIGRSNIVGKPMAALLLRHNATVTVCHSKTQNLGELTRQADIVIVATGHRHTLTADMVKEGAVVIDVGMNRNELGKLCGDVDFDEVKEKASFITPVPGGVGPMTITELLENTILAAQRHHS